MSDGEEEPRPAASAEQINVSESCPTGESLHGFSLQPLPILPIGADAHRVHLLPHMLKLIVPLNKGELIRLLVHRLKSSMPRGQRPFSRSRLTPNCKS